MKKAICIILVTIILTSLFSIPVSAKVGDVIGTALHTDIIAYINNYAIPSYAVNGQSVIVAEDLRNFGFDVTWNNQTRSLTINRNRNTSVSELNFTKDSTASGKKFTNILATDIKVYVGHNQITSYAMNGYTMIPMEELTMLGEVYWVSEERALKMWVDNLHIRSTKQKVFSVQIRCSNCSGTGKNPETEAEMNQRLHTEVERARNESQRNPESAFARERYRRAIENLNTVYSPYCSRCNGTGYQNTLQ